MIRSLGIIGSGEVARALAKHTVNAGYRVLISNSRGPASLVDVVNQICEGRQIVFCACDYEAARAEFAAYVERLGFARVSVGGVRDGGKLMQLGGSLSGVHAIRQV